MNRKLWNEDGTPRRPELPNELIDQHPFADFADVEVVESQENTPWANRLRQQMKANTPASVGDIVHFWDGDACVAAMVTETGIFEDEGDYLTLFQPRQQPGYSAAGILHREDKGRDSWHWPESQ